MPAPQRLSYGSLVPAAKPVSSFMSFSTGSNPAAPGRPSLMPQTPRVVSIQKGGTRDVQGSNSAQELAEALRPLTNIYNAGAELYASNEYKKGQNEILKAAANISEETIARSLDYAAQNRQVDASNPIAGVLMDQANPFRQAGRVNQASQWVAKLAPQQFRTEWAKQASNLSKLDPGSATGTAVQASVTNRLANAFGLDEFSPGFQKYVIPQINRGWEWFQNQQYAAHTQYEKATGVTQTAEYLTSLLLQPGGVTPVEWDQALAQQMATYGLQGEPTKKAEEIILAVNKRLRLLASDPRTRQSAGFALSSLMGMSSGLYDSNGNPINVSAAYGVDILKDAAEISRNVKTLRDNADAAAMYEMERDPVFESTIGMDPQSSDWAIADAELQRRYPQLSDADRRQKLIEQSNQSEQWQGVTFDQRVVDDFIYDQEGRFGSDWDAGAANKRWRELTQNAPPSVRRALQQRWDDVRQTKQREQGGELDSPTMNEMVELNTRALINDLFPDGGPGMIRWMEANPGGDLIGYLGTIDRDKAETLEMAIRQYRVDGATRIREATAENGGPLRPEQQRQIWADTWKDIKPLLMPIQPAATADPESGLPQQGGADAAPVTYYSPSQQVPEEVVKSGVPIYSREDTTELLGTLANGGGVNSQVKRAAFAAGLTPGQFVLQQADLLGIPIPEPMRKKVLRQSNQSLGIQRSLAAAAPGGGPLAQSTGAFLNILTGSAPTYSRPITG